ncbi:MAG: hypothetical protein AAFX99_32370, partial [Myxococcota bacterium]
VDPAASQSSVGLLRVGRYAALAVVMGIVAWLLCSGGRWAQAQDDDAKALEAYVKASIELACNTSRYGGSAQDVERERANQAALRKHGFSERTYLESAAQWSSDPRVKGAIESGQTRCDGVPNFAEGLYDGSFRRGSIEVKLSVRVRSGQVHIGLQGLVSGQHIRVSNSWRPSGVSLRVEGKQQGGFSGLGYALELRQRNSKTITMVAVVSSERGGTNTWTMDAKVR